MAIAEHFKSLCQATLIPVPLGKGAHDLRVIDNESRAMALGFKKLADQLVNES